MMTSFKNQIIRNIKRGTYTREFYEALIANWLINGWLTEDEAFEVFEVLDEEFPVMCVLNLHDTNGLITSKGTT